MGHREILGVGSDASTADIKKAFRDAAKEHHPDLSDSPEAAESFRRIKEAHDALIKESEAPKESTTATSSAAYAAAATAKATHANPDPQQQQMTEEELQRVQDLDQEARKAQKRSLFRRSKEPAELRRHRKKLKTNERRLRGLY